MAKRGLGASSMYAEALATGIMNSAIPIAQSDANTYKEMIFANLNNRQQTAVQNAQNSLQLDVSNLSNRQQAAMQNSSLRHNTLLSDQSATNAAEQFNATSQSPVSLYRLRVRSRKWIAKSTDNPRVSEERIATGIS